MNEPSGRSRPPRIISTDTHTTVLPDVVYQEALHLLVSGSITERRRAAQLLASAYADDEERRLAGEE